jgi:hypothetical protein
MNFRIILVLFVWFAFWWGGAWCCAKDVAAPYWALGVYSLPVALPLIWLLDRSLASKRVFLERMYALAALDCALAGVLYILLLVPTLWIVHWLSSRELIGALSWYVAVA